ncbi:MAG: nitroreductase [Thermoplasmatales archaeon SG8-52-3]|nr:MAG: nitroreductase [Thermoplasmatales archaeon SG8-52-3]
MEFENVIKSRQSVRDYSSKKVENEKINFIIECARFAPSWTNKQCWQFILVEEKKIIEELAKTSIINRWLKNVPMIIVACGNPKESGNRNDIDYYIVDVAIALEHIILAATDKGLGTCWIGGFDEKKVKEILNIPENFRVIAMTPLGYPAEKKSLIGKMAKVVTQSKKRKSFEKITHINKW